MELTKEQAKIIASAITLDIRSYIDAHRDEYEAWLKEQNIPNQEKPKNQKEENKICLEQAVKHRINA